MRRTGKGFTLLELIVTLTVLAILAVIAIPAFTAVIDHAGKDSARVTAEYFLSEVKSIYEQDHSGLLPNVGSTDLSAAEAVAAVDTPLAVAVAGGYTFTLNSKTVSVSSTGVIS